MSKEVFEWIKEHCSYCPESLFNVAQALLSVSEHLDYNLQYELEYLLGKYVIKVAKMSPDGLSSILSKFPLTSTDADKSMIEESLKKISSDIREKLPDEIKVKLAKQLNSFISESNKLDDEYLKESLPPEPKPMNDKIETEQFRESISVIQESSSDSGDLVFTVRLIQSGKTKSRRYFSDNVLREAIPLFEGARSYTNHPPNDYSGGDRPVQDLSGWFSNVTLREGDGLYAVWHLLSSSSIKDTVLELSSKGKLDLIGLSLLGTGQSKVSRIDGELYKEAISINSVRSVDIVDVPGAGGFIEPIKMNYEKENIEMLEGLENLSLDELKAARPDLFPEEDIKESSSSENQNETISNPNTQMSEYEMRLALRERNLALEDSLRDSNLPTPMREALRNQFKDKIFDDNELKTQIHVYRESAAEISQPESKFFVPSYTYNVIDEHDKLQAAMDKTFGLEVDEKFASVPRFTGIREAYLKLTGDYDFSFGAQRLDEQYREALPTAANVVGGGTITFSNVLGTSINRRLVRQYRRQNMWWMPIVTMRDLNNLKQQDANRLEALGALTERTTGGAEYTELTWAEQVHNWTPTEYGNVLPVAQRAIINDELGALTRAADEMGRSAGITLNEYVRDLLTASTPDDGNGTGPTHVDKDQTDGSADGAGIRVFNAAQHNNRIVANLSFTSWDTVDQALRGMIDAAGKKIGLTPKYLVYPHNLRKVAYEIVESELVPNSANNARNRFNSDNLEAIEAVTLTDTNNWWAFASPDQLDFFEMGFLNGRQEPEFWVQTDPTTGYVFSHDVIMYKVRHRYGGGYVDYRGAHASIVA